MAINERKWRPVGQPGQPAAAPVATGRRTVSVARPQPSAAPADRTIPTVNNPQVPARDFVPFPTAKGAAPVVNDGGMRHFVVLKLNGPNGKVHVPFYQSSGENKKPGVREGDWVPVLAMHTKAEPLSPERAKGYHTDSLPQGWINKTHGAGQGYGIPEIQQAMQSLNADSPGGHPLPHMAPADPKSTLGPGELAPVGKVMHHSMGRPGALESHVNSVLQQHLGRHGWAGPGDANLDTNVQALRRAFGR